MTFPIYEQTLRLPMEGVEVIFDARNPNFNKAKPTYNEFFLKNFEAVFNDMLRARGYVFLNEVLSTLGFDQTAYGVVAGWHLSLGPNFISFDMEYVELDPAIPNYDIRIRFLGVEPIVELLLK